MSSADIYASGTLPYQPPSGPSTPDSEPEKLLRAPSPPSSLPASQPKPPRTRFTTFVKVLLFGLVLALAQVVVPAVLAAYLFIVYYGTASTETWILRSTAPFNRVTTIANFVETAFSLSVGPVMGIYAYSVAAKWLRASASADIKQKGQLVTPVQLGLAMSLLGQSNWSSLYKYDKHAAGFGKSLIFFKRNKVTPPRYLARAAALLTWLLGCRAIASGINAALQYTGGAALVPGRPSTVVPAEARSLGRAVNTTRCDTFSNGGDGTVTYSGNAVTTCGLDLGRNYNGWFPQSQTVLSNTSTAHAVAWTTSGEAILVPPTLPQYGYQATTTAAQSACRSVTAQCTTCEVGAFGPRCDGPEAYPNFNCSADAHFDAAALFHFEQQASHGMPYGSVLLANGSAGVYSGSGNTFPMGFIITSSAYSDGIDNDHFNGDTGFLRHGNAGTWNVLQCNVTALQVSYVFSPPSTFRIVSRSNADNDLTSYLAVNPEVGLSDIVSAVQGAGLNGALVSYSTAFGRALSKSVLSMASVVFEPARTLQVQSPEVLGTVLDLRLYLAFNVLAALASLAILYITLSTLTHLLLTSSPYTHGLSKRLRDPLFLLNLLYGRRVSLAQHEAAKTSPWSGEAIKLFEPEREEDRLVAGTWWDGEGWALKGERMTQ
ncbi:hypothetical protein JCM6882_000609 [Rhodosporidiobolus microsporus]